MPELPEVEAARRAIEDHCVGKKIVSSTIANDSKVIDGVSAKDFETSINGKRIVAAHRKGKNMWLQLDSPPFPSFQFGMAGAVYIKGVAVTKYKRAAVKDTDEWPSKYSKFFVQLDDGLELSFTDKRRFARVRLLNNPAAEPPISELGPDVLLEPMTVGDFLNSLSKKKISIKALLLDQNFISGIGNWIADEVLYQARIHPLQMASSMSKENCETLLNSINEVIAKAVECGADSSEFPDNWIFHFREKKPGKAFIDGKKIEFINAGGRTTAYVSELQKLTGAQGAKPVGKPLKTSAKGTKKKGGGSDDDGDPESEEEAKPRDTGVKPGKKTTNRKRAPEKKNAGGTTNSSDDDSDDDDNVNTTGTGKKKSKARNNDAEKKKPSGKTAPRKRQRAAAEDGDDDDDNGDEKESEEREEEKKTKRKVESRQNRRGTKKKAK